MKKNVVFLSVCLGIILLLGIGVSYSLWNISISQGNTNLVTTKCFNVEITSQNNSISLENAYPISNENGKKLTPFSFTITNTCDIFASYTVNLESLKGSNLSSKFLNAMINNEEIKRLSDYDTTDVVNSGSIESHTLARGSLGSGDSEDYTLRIWIDYDTTMEDLDNEIKTFKSKIVVKAQPSNWSPVDEGYTTLHDAILANEYQTSPDTAIKKIEAKGTPDLSRTAPISENDLSDKGLYKSVDDYGDTYYYRGKVNNNNVYFAGFYWQIIRINGDGSIRLLYNGTEKNAQGEEKACGKSPFNSLHNKVAYVGYMYGNVESSIFDDIHANIYSSTIKQYLDNWYKTNIVDKEYSDNVSTEVGFCGDRSLYSGDGISNNNYSFFKAYFRYGENTAQFTCPDIERDLYTTAGANLGNKALKFPVALPSSDELEFAGLSNSNQNMLSYISANDRYWIMSALSFNGIDFHVYSWTQDNGVQGNHWVNSYDSVRPVINLKADVKIAGGIGTINDPFVVE